MTISRPILSLLGLLSIGICGYSQTLDSEQKAFLALINDYRAQNGAGPLQVSVALQNSSQWMSNDMATNNRFDHTDSLGRDPFARMDAFGYPGGNGITRAENIAAGRSDAQNTLNDWIATCDPDVTGVCTFAHRQNMLDPRLKVLGIGRAFNANSDHHWYWTTDFGSVVDPTLATPPEVLSVSPNNGTGSPLTFSVVYSDPVSTTDLQVVYLDFATSPGAAGSCMAAYVPSSNALYLLNDAGNGLVSGSLTPGGAGTLSNSQCTLSGSGGAVTRSADKLTVPFNIAFATGFTGTKTVYGYAQSSSGANSGWQSLGSWAPASAPLSAVSVTPSSGNGAGPQTFTAVYSDPNGTSDLQVVYLDFGTSPGAAISCMAAYVPSSNALYLLNDNGSGLVSGSAMPGGAGSVSNSQCTLTGRGGPVTSAGTNLTVPFSITFASGFTGAKNIYGYAQNARGSNSGWQTLGTWTPATAALSAVSVTPNSGGGFGPTTFTGVFTDPIGAGDLQVVYLDFGNSPGGANTCMVAYVPSGNALYLLNDATTGLAGAAITPGGPGSVSNSQCTLTGNGGPVTVSSSLSVPFSVTFAARFTGAKTIYGLAQAYGGTQSGWKTLGSWTP